MSYFSQMVGPCAQNFLAGAAGLAVGIAFIRGLARQLSNTLGNFWVDLTRALLWVLLPGALIGASLLVWQGVPMNFHHYAVARTVEGTQQVIPQGPVAALEIIKNLGTNGGGFFNANGAHPYENPTPFTNFLEMLAVVLLPAAFTNTFGTMVGQPRQGWLLYYVMLLLFVVGLVSVHHFEQKAPKSPVAKLHLEASAVPHYSLRICRSSASGRKPKNNEIPGQLPHRLAHGPIANSTISYKYGQ